MKRSTDSTIMSTVLIASAVVFAVFGNLSQHKDTCLVLSALFLVGGLILALDRDE